MATAKSTRLVNTRKAVGKTKDRKLRASFERIALLLEQARSESADAAKERDCLRALISLGINLQIVLGKRLASELLAGAIMDASELNISLADAGLFQGKSVKMRRSPLRSWEHLVCI